MTRPMTVPPRDVQSWEGRIFPLLRAALATGYFGLEVEGEEHVPATGQVVFVGNHSGWFALDALMFNLAVHDAVGPHRVTYAVVQDALLRLPVLRQFFSPLGVIPASLLCEPRDLPAEVDTFGVFPEGVSGICKPLWRAYQMEEWRSGFVRLALARSAKVVPCALVGGEECLPSLGAIRSLERALGVAVPLPLWPLPLPTRWKIVFGAPIDFGDLPAEAGDDVALCREQVPAVRQAVQDLLDRHTLARPIRRASRLLHRRRWFV